MVKRKCKWPDEKVFAYVKARHNRGEYINRNTMLKEDPEGGMVWALSHGSRFGSWRNFLTAFKNFYNLDLDIDEIERDAKRRGIEKRTIWSREGIKEKVLLYHEKGKNVSYKEIMEYDSGLVKVATTTRNKDGSKKYYNDWEDVLSDCRLLHVAKIKKQSKQRIVKEIIEYANEHGKENLVFEVAIEKIPTTLRASKQPKFFCGWKKAVETAGFKYGPLRGQEYSNDLLDGSIRGLFREKREKKKKKAVIDAAVKIIRETERLSRSDFKDETMVFDRREYKLIVQIDYNFGGITAFGQELSGGKFPLTTYDLILLYQNTQSREALDALYRENIDLIDRAARSVQRHCRANNTPCVPLSELHNEGFFAFENAVRKIQFYGSFPAYAWIWVRNQMIKANKRLFGSRHYTLDESYDIEKSNIPGPFDITSERALIEEMHKNLRRLPRRYRDALRMQYEKNMTFSQIGETLGISPEVARMLGMRARRALRSLMEQ